MSRSHLAPLVVAAALAAGGCSTTDSARDGDGGRPAAKAAEESPAREGPGVADYAMVLPENVVWLPWKVIGGGVKGASDGVQAGFASGRMPMLGLLFSPVNLVTGFVTGLVQGAGTDPAFVGPEDSFSRAMSAPSRQTTSIWWYP